MESETQRNQIHRREKHVNLIFFWKNPWKKVHWKKQEKQF